MGIFSGLKNLGLGELEDSDLFAEEEKAEQAQLRKEYVTNVRANLRGQLDNITIERPDGSKENLGEKFGRK